MKRIGILAAAVMAAGALWAAAPSVTITKAQQRYPWNDKIDIDWSLTCDTSHLYGLKFLLIDGVTTNTLMTDITIRPVDNIESKSGRTTVDIPTQFPDLDEKLRTGGIQIVGVLIDKGLLDSGDGVTFVPGDYLCLNLEDGTVTPLLNVQNPEQYNVDAYKTTLMLFRRIPAGSFKMQATDTVNLANTTGTQVTIPNDYYIAVFECTQKQWATVAGSVTREQHTPGDTVALMYVSWDMIAGTTSPQYISTLNAKISASGYQVALPNEAQWERAARAGSTTQWFFGSTDSEVGTYSWYWNNSSGKIHAVGGKSPNAWGLYDVYGNVDEWCQDWWYESLNYSQQPGGPSSGSQRVCRGGCFTGYTSYCSSVYQRYGVDQSAAGQWEHGFRLIMTHK